MLVIFLLFLFCFSINLDPDSASVANVATLLSKSEMNSVSTNLSTNPFIFVLLLIMSLIN